MRGRQRNMDPRCKACGVPLTPDNRSGAHLSCKECKARESRMRQRLVRSEHTNEHARNEPTEWKPSERDVAEQKLSLLSVELNLTPSMVQWERMCTNAMRGIFPQAGGSHELCNATA